MFRYSAITKTIDESDTSILSNITKVKMYKNITPTLNSGLKYTLSFNNAFYNPHSGHNATLGGITSSTGFTIAGNTNTLYIDDDGNGIIRTYYLVGGQTRTYVDASAGTINYASGKIVLTDLNITSASNTDGTISVDILPASNEPGLQVKAQDGSWLDVPCDFGSLIVNIGDMLQEASGHYFPSTTHRVVNPDGADMTKSRISLPLFLHPRPDVKLSERHTAGTYLQERLKELGVI